MIQFRDSFGIDRGIDFNLSFCGRYVNLTLFAPAKSNYGNVLQIPIDAFIKVISQIDQLMEEVNHDKEI